jgi:diguanylate cyclase (GGDEF)-like protein
LDKPLRPELTSRSIELLYFQSSNAYSASIAAGAILVVLFWNHAPRTGIAAWAISYGIMIAIRHQLGTRFRAAPRRAEDSQRWLLYYATAVGICGVIWGVYGAFLAQHADAYQLAVVLLALGALLSGAVISYSVSMPVYLAFSVPTMVPVALWLTLSPVYGKQFLGMMVLVWVVFMFFAARRFRRFALESLGYQCNLEELAGQLKTLSSMDGLTNVPGRRSFDEELDAAQTSAHQDTAPLSLILCDIDCFKQYNAAYGEMQGDVCLRTIAAQLDTLARRHGAWVARIGGEEFGVIARRTDEDDAARLAEGFRETVERLRIVHSNSQVSSVVTASFGVSSMVSTANNSSPDLLHRAQHALNEAKRCGGNRVCTDQSDRMTSGTAPSADSRGRKSAHG